jgi:hypothetical protein
MITDAGIPFFARRKPPTPRNLKDASRAKTARRHFWQRREVTTFQKCLAVHMYYAAAPQRLQK